jgi:hypothetical protein
MDVQIFCSVIWVQVKGGTGCAVGNVDTGGSGGGVGVGGLHVPEPVRPVVIGLLMSGAACCMRLTNAPVGWSTFCITGLYPSEYPLVVFPKTRSKESRVSEILKISSAAVL